MTASLVNPVTKKELAKTRGPPPVIEMTNDCGSDPPTSMFCLAFLPFCSISRSFTSVPSRTVFLHRHHVSEPYHVSRGRCPTWDTVGVVGRQADATTYRIQEIPGTISEKSVSLIVVHSSALEAKTAYWEAQTLEAGVHRIDESLQSVLAATFACRADAELAWKRWCATKWLRRTGWGITGQVVAREGSVKCGEPELQWRIEAARNQPNPAFLDAERFRRSTFILVANDPRRTARELLTAYKTQGIVEQDNALVKGPLRIAPPFLKDTKKLRPTSM